MKKIAVIAGSLKEYENFLINVRNKSGFIYAGSVEKIIGLEINGYICVGTYYEKPGIDRIIVEAKLRTR